MPDLPQVDFVWWITMVEIPVVGAIFWMVQHGRRETDRRMLKLYTEIHNNLSSVLDNIAEYKIEVAKAYVTFPSVKDLEARLTRHLVRLEDRMTILSDRRWPDETRCARGPVLSLQRGPGMRGDGTD